MAAFHVFVEGATDSSPAGLQRLADAIGKHYGLPGADLHARLVRGRFRVKGNTDSETAALYKRDLERLGAVVTIEEATAENSGRATPLPFPAVRPETPPAGMPVVRAATQPAGRATATPPAGSPAVRPATQPTGLAAATATPPGGSRPATQPTGLAAAAATPPAGSPVARPSSSSLPPQERAATPPPVGGFQSGLAAAFSADAPAASLGALDTDNASFSLGSVDGSDHADAGSPPAASFEPPGGGGGGLPASIGPAPDKAAGKPAKPAKPKDEPLDLFAPPESQGEAFKVDIASDELEVSARKRVSTPPPMETVPAAAAAGAATSSQQLPRAQTQPSARKSQPSIQPANVQGAVVAASSSKLGPLGNERTRLVAGVVLAILLGFVPAHFIAGMREESAYAEIDRKVIKAQQQADSPETYALLDRTRADLLARKEAERRNAAIIAIVVWGIAGAAIGFVWFRKIPWDSFE